MIIIIICIAGFAVSLYGFYIEQKIKKDATYKPLCDISDAASCSKPIRSAFGNLLGVSNMVIGMLFYAAIAFLAWAGYYQLVFLGAVGACIASLFLAYILYTKIKTFCLICTATYVINGLLLVASWCIIFR